MRHVAVLAAAVVMLTAVAVPAQGEPAVDKGQGGIDEYCIAMRGGCDWGAWAYDHANTVRILRMRLYDSNGILLESVEAGPATGGLRVDSVTAYQWLHRYVILELFKVRKDQGIRLIDYVVCTYEDDYCVPPVPSGG